MKILSIDIGGSSIKTALFNNSTITKRKNYDNFNKTYSGLIEKLLEIKNEYLVAEAVTISMPGIIDSNKGVVKYCDTFKFAHNVEFASKLESLLNIPVVICNDAKACAYAELYFGSLTKYNDAVVLVFGTGIGGAIVLDKKVREGINLSCGEVSSLYTEKDDKAKEFWKECGISGLSKKIASAINSDKFYNGFEVFELINSNDKAYEAFKDYCKIIATQIFNIQVLLDVEIFSIGGGISNQQLFIDLLSNEVDKIFDLDTFGKYIKPKIHVCKLKNDANLYGAIGNYYFKKNIKLEVNDAI